MNKYIFLLFIFLTAVLLSKIFKSHTIEGFRATDITKEIKRKYNEKFRNIRRNKYNPAMKKIKSYI